MVSETDPINSVPGVQVFQLCPLLLVSPPGTEDRDWEWKKLHGFVIQCAKHFPWIVSLNPYKSRRVTISSLALPLGTGSSEVM